MISQTRLPSRRVQSLGLPSHRQEGQTAPRSVHETPSVHAVALSCGLQEGGMPWDEMNNIAASVLANLTSGMRFEGRCGRVVL